MCSLNPILEKNVILCSNGIFHFALDELEIEKLAIYSAACKKHDHTLAPRACSLRMHLSGNRKRQSVCSAKIPRICCEHVYLEQNFAVFGGRFNVKNILPIITPLPACRFPTTGTQFPFSDSGVIFFGTF